MRSRPHLLSCTILTVALAIPVTAAERPNVVLIMTDNHGAWTLGCYGNKDIRTPNIDQLAAEGTLFDNALASNPVCSPTRATTLTGLIPSQHGVHCFLRGGRLQTGPEARCTLDEFTSLPEVLKREGYRCGLVGKWHLGGNESPQEGFDDYWITMPHGGTSTFYDAQIIENGKLRSEPEYLTDFWTKHAVKFIRQSSRHVPRDESPRAEPSIKPAATTQPKAKANGNHHSESDGYDKRPFFLFLAYNGPYSLSRLLLREGQNRHTEFYRGKELPSFPREKPHPWQLHNRDYQNNQVSIQRVATEVSGVDDGVGTVMAALKANGLDDNTVVIFMADQGWVGGHGGFFGMGDHTRPVTAVDGMMKIPLIVRQPGRIAAGHRSQKLVANYDIYNTLLDHLGIEAKKTEGEPVSPGRSFTAELGLVTNAAKTSFNPMPQARLTEAKNSLAHGVGFASEPGLVTNAAKNSFNPMPQARLTEAKNSLADGVGLNDSTLARGLADDAVFYEFETLRCIRTADWKYTERFPNGPHELYDLKTDPQEFTNLYQSKPLGVQLQLQQRLHSFFAKYASPKYDLLHGGGSQSVIYDGVEEEIAQADPTPPPALPADFETKQFTLPEGFSSQLIAGPPLVNHPTMGCFDDIGRLFVCDGKGVNMSAEELEENLPNEIRMLEDQDGDGVFDKSTVFADRMTFPMGGTWHDGALYVASPPNIWRLEDTTGDGKADKRDILVDKFGYTGNAASIHGCFKHPSGRIYWCDGYHGHEFKDKDGNITSKRKGSYIFSCWPDGSDVRIHCGGGMDNPVEVDFTDEGDIIGTVNILYTRPRIDCLVHWQYGGAYPHREAVLDELKLTGDLLGPIHKFGHVAISGTTRYRSGVMNHNWGDNFFATQFNLGKVVRVELEPSGSTYSCTEREFLSCSNRDFHPTDVIEDADGSLLVVDTGGWFYRGCPTSQIAKPDIRGGIYRIVRDGMTTQVDPRGNRIDWAARAASQLMQDLKDTRYAVRENAIQECVRRGDVIVPQLASTAKNGDILARQNAIWALTRMLSQSESKVAVTLRVTNERTADIQTTHATPTVSDTPPIEGTLES
ncbi:MAG: sulfatase-like hydrolase/transferase, partial [Planctomycetaceae bacterium]